jgi:hypothetical protein
MKSEWFEAVVAFFQAYLHILLDGLRKTTKNLSQDIGCPDRDLSPGPPEYEAGVLATRPRRSVIYEKEFVHSCSSVCRKMVTRQHSDG